MLYKIETKVESKNDEKVPKLKYPCYLTYGGVNKRYIVLFSSASYGMVIFADVDAPYSVSYYSSCWTTGDFQHFLGTITTKVSEDD